PWSRTHLKNPFRIFEMSVLPEKNSTTPISKRPQGVLRCVVGRGCYQECTRRKPRVNEGCISVGNRELLLQMPPMPRVGPTLRTIVVTLDRGRNDVRAD